MIRSFRKNDSFSPAETNKPVVPLTAVAGFAGWARWWYRSWGLRPRLYAVARSRGLLL